MSRPPVDDAAPPRDGSSRSGDEPWARFRSAAARRRDCWSPPGSTASTGGPAPTSRSPTAMDRLVLRVGADQDAAVGPLPAGHALGHLREERLPRVVPRPDGLGPHLPGGRARPRRAAAPDRGPRGPGLAARDHRHGAVPGRLPPAVPDHGRGRCPRAAAGSRSTATASGTSRAPTPSACRPSASTTTSTWGRPTGPGPTATCGSSGASRSSTGLGLEVESVVANDPFFGRPGRMLAANQRIEELKFELVTPVYADRARQTAISSSNCHLDHFGRPFGIETADGEVAHTACFGFGIDRITLALLHRHGTDPDRWPAGGPSPAVALSRPGDGDSHDHRPALRRRRAGFRPHPLHATERNWTETNCYVDVWIEVLHALGLDPVAAAAFTLSADFEGDQWTFFKYPPEDLRTLFGLEVSELNVWRPVIDHVDEQLELGRLCTVEVDSWFLPDTRGVSYRHRPREDHHRPQALDSDGRRLGYFHNAGYFELEGDDFDGIFRLRRPRRPARAAALRGADPAGPGPAGRPRPGRPGGGADPRPPGRRPADNPIARLGERLAGGPSVAGRPGPRDLPPLLLRDLPAVRRHGRAGRRRSSTGSTGTTVPGPRRRRSPSPSWPPGPRPSSSPWPGWFGAARSTWPDPRRHGRHWVRCMATLVTRYGDLRPTSSRAVPLGVRLHAARRGHRPGRPGRAAAALDAPPPSRARRPGRCGVVGRLEPSSAELDAEDWWFRCRFAGPGPGRPGPGRGLAPRAGRSGHGGRRVAQRRAPGPLRVDVHAVPHPRAGAAAGQRAGHPLLRPGAPSGRAAAAPALEVHRGLAPEPPVVPDHPARPPARLGGDPGTGRSLAPGPPAARGRRTRSSAPAARDALRDGADGTEAGTVSVELR